MAAAATVCNAVPVNSTPRIKRRLNPCALFLKHYNPFGGRNHKSSNRGHRQSAHCLRSERCPYLSGRRAWSTTYVRFPSLFLRKAHWWTAMNHCVCVCVRRVCDTQLGQCAMRLKLVRVSLCAKRGCAISGAVPSLQCVCVCVRVALSGPNGKTCTWGRRFSSRGFACQSQGRCSRVWDERVPRPGGEAPGHKPAVKRSPTAARCTAAHACVFV